MGLKRTKRQFWIAIRNPVFCGKIYIPKFKDEEAYFVRATHEPLISEELFYQAQKVIEGRGRYYQPKIITNIKYPFRGMSICHCCGKKLTASTSKGGRGGEYSYYHCVKPCRVRFKTEEIDQAFYEEVSKYIPKKKEIKKLYAALISEAYHKETRDISVDRKEVLTEIKDQEAKLSNARELIATNKIDEDDFRELKTKCIERIERLERKLNQLALEVGNVDSLLDSGIQALLNFEKNVNSEAQYEFKSVIAAMFPENFTYDGQRLRTTRTNTILQFIFLIDNELEKQKNRQINTKIDLSGKVVNPDHEKLGQHFRFGAFKDKAIFLFKQIDFTI